MAKKHTGPGTSPEIIAGDEKLQAKIDADKAAEMAAKEMLEANAAKRCQEAMARFHALQQELQVNALPQRIESPMGVQWLIGFVPR